MKEEEVQGEKLVGNNERQQRQSSLFLMAFPVHSGPRSSQWGTEGAEESEVEEKEEELEVE